jgi:hypothetical protein
MSQHEIEALMLIQALCGDGLPSARDEHLQPFQQLR